MVTIASEFISGGRTERWATLVSNDPVMEILGLFLPILHIQRIFT